MAGETPALHVAGQDGGGPWAAILAVISTLWNGLCLSFEQPFGR